MEEYKEWKWCVYTMDKVFSIDWCTRDDTITSWMHTYNGVDNEWIDESDTQKNNWRFLSGKLFHV